MANNFSTDTSCQALYRFEHGALTVDSIRSNTLTAVATPTEDLVNFKEGACSAVLNGSTQYFVRTDTNLSANFPLKSTDTVKQATFAGWFYFNAANWNACFSKRPAGYGMWMGSGASGQLY